MNKNKLQETGERGMVSFMVTLIMMSVITLVVVGFSQVTRRSQRQSLDRQLSAQAFYAAESGVNVATKRIAEYVSGGGDIGKLATKKTCANDYEPDSTVSPDGVSEDTIQDLAQGVRYTCVLVDAHPKRLDFAADQRGSTVMPLNADQALNSLTFTWSARKDGTKYTCSGSNGFDFKPAAGAASNWNDDCDLGIMRVDIERDPADVAGKTDQADYFEQNQTTLFLTPRGSHSLTAKSATFGLNHPSAVVISGYGNQKTSGRPADGGECTKGCKAVVNLPGGSANYIIRVSMLYNDAQSVTVTGNDGTTRFNGAEAILDVTGQAQDELRRIRVAIGLSSTANSLPMYALGSSVTICKDFTALPDDPVVPANTCSE